MDDKWVGLMIMGGLGLFLLIGGIVARLGLYKSLYVMNGNPAFAPVSLAYMSIPGSALFFSFALVFFLPSVEIRRQFLFFFILPYQVFLIVLSIWRPWWLKPAWIRWIEKEHSYIQPLLWEDARKNIWKWERQMRTQKDLEKWVSEVQQKHGLE